MSTEDGGQQVEESFNLGSAIDDIAGEMGLNGGEKKVEGEGGQQAAPEGQDPAAPPAGEKPPVPGPGAPAPAEGAQPAPAAAPTTGPAAPDTWTAEGKAAWATLPEAVKTEVVKREQDMQRGLEDYGKRAKVGDYFAEQVQPYAEMYAQNGLQVGRLVRPLLNAYATLSWGDAEQKTTMLKAMAQDAGIDLTKLATGEPAAAPQDPRIARLQNEINTLRQGVQQSLGAITQTRYNETAKTVEAFAADTAKHPYFLDVMDDMKRLVDSGVATGLEDAYDKAVMNNPVTRAKEIDRLTSLRVEQKAKDAAAAAAKVKKVTAHNVRSSE